ncbi:MAG: aldehyde dehydrogenase family protein [Bdellovibrionota bacterium]
MSKKMPDGLLGLSFIGGAPVKKPGDRKFEKMSPVTGACLGTVTGATIDQVADAANYAFEAFQHSAVLQSADPLFRAQMLEAVAAELEASMEEIRPVYYLESGLPIDRSDPNVACRFEVEFGRTVNQLKFHASDLRNGTWCIPVISKSAAFDIRQTAQGIGPVAIWGAINFPLAFSTAGGDFADAWRSGCPVVFKAHSEHPFTSELVAQCIVKALAKVNAHPGWFSMLHGDREIGLMLMENHKISAGALTGSVAAAKALKAVADARGVPFFAECGSWNAVFVFPDLLESSAESIAKQYVASVTMGAGQFCTCPNGIVVPRGPGLDEFLTAVKNDISARPASTMLSARTCRDFNENVARLLRVDGMSVLAGGDPIDHATQSKPVILTISGIDFLHSPERCQHEAFGHCSVVVIADGVDQMLAIAEQLEGSLTATRYGTPQELSTASAMQLRRILESKAGRIIANAMPTGVAVCDAMVHGGPSPACTIDSTSVGLSTRFQRRICFQSEADSTLPVELQNGNPLGVLRRVNGVFTRDPVAV